jgi:hypothetical protein
MASSCTFDLFHRESLGPNQHNPVQSNLRSGPLHLTPFELSRQLEQKRRECRVVHFQVILDC